MSVDQHNSGDAPPPHAQLIQMGTAYWISKVVYAAAKLGLADQLATGPRSAAEPSAAAAAYDFSAFKTVVDVGGATGNMLAAILSRHGGPRGVLFDMPHVVGDAPALLRERGVEKRVTIEAGDFFKAVPAGG